MTDTALIEKMRAALRISSTSDKVTEEIADCIAACKDDLANDGVTAIDEKKPLIVRAITLYCKAEFGYNNKAEQFRKYGERDVRNGHQRRSRRGRKWRSGWMKSL